MSRTWSRSEVEAEFTRFLNGLGFFPETVKASGKPERFSITYPNGQRKKNGSYKLHADGRPNGWVRDWSNAELGFKWLAEKPAGERMSPAEVKALRAEQESATRAKKEKEDAERRAATAAAQAYWDAAPSADPAHGYLTRKRIGPHTARMGTDGLAKDALLIPMHDRDGALMSITRIWANGDKKAWPGAPARIGDAWARTWIGAAPQDADVLIVGEGFSTVACVAELYPNTAACVAFTAVALASVAGDIRRAFPDKPIVVLQDDDDPAKGETGQKAARKAGDAARAAIAIPVREGAIADQAAVDFNDMTCADLHDRVREIIDAAIVEARRVIEAFTPTPADDDDGPSDDDITDMDVIEQDRLSAQLEDWRRALLYTSRGDLRIKSIENCRIVIENRIDLRDLFRFNAFSKRIMLAKRPPWDKSGSRAPWQERAFTDADTLEMIAILEHEGLAPSKEMVESALVLYTNRPGLRYDPIADYLDRLNWDGTSRLDTWLIDICGAADTPFVRAVAAKWMISGVARGYTTTRDNLRETQVDTTLCLEGKQGLGKSQVFRELSTIDGERFCLDNGLDVKNKDDKIACLGVWIRELAELDGIGRANIAGVRNYLTQPADIYRSPYARQAERHPRRFICGATINPNGEGYLHDQTGNRRFWPVAVKTIDIERLREVKDQLWAEAVVRFEAGEKWWIDDPALMKAAAAEVDARTETDAFMGSLAAYLRTRPKHKGYDDKPVTTTKDVAQRVFSMSEKDINPGVARRAASMLKRLGWVSFKAKSGPLRDERLWTPGDDWIAAEQEDRPDGAPDPTSPPPDGNPGPRSPAPAAAQAVPAKETAEGAPTSPPPSEKPIAAQAEPKDPSIVRFPGPGKTFRVGPSGPGEIIDWPPPDDADPDEAILRAAEALRPEDVQPIAGKPAWQR